jgi:hypothetical protein
VKTLGLAFENEFDPFLHSVLLQATAWESSIMSNASVGKARRFAYTRKAFAQNDDARGRGAAARVLRDARGGRIPKRMG